MGSAPLSMCSDPCKAGIAVPPAVILTFFSIGTGVTMIPVPASILMESVFDDAGIPFTTEYAF
ncbi:hypothetical protein D3C71_2199750 [compost metagenome]